MPWILTFVFALVCLLPSYAMAQQEEEEIPLETMSGKQIYLAFCARCHGEDGKGQLPEDMIENMEAPPPDLTDGYFSSREKRKDWQAVVAHGGGARGLSLSMPAWGEALSEQQIAETVEYMKTFVDQSKYPQGETNFFRGHYTAKAFTEQEALVILSHQFKRENGITTSETKTVLYYANRFGTRFQYEAKLPLINSSGGIGNKFGIGDLELALKYAFFDNAKTLSIITVGVEAALPTGSETNGFGAGTVVAIPYVAAGQGIGNTLQLSTSAKLETPSDNKKGDPELRVGFLSMLTIPESKQGFFPGVELFWKKNLAKSEYMLSVIPQVYWGITARGHLALSLGAEVPVAGTKAFDGKIVAFFLWDFVDGGLWW